MFGKILNVWTVWNTFEWICNSSEAFVLPRIRPLSSKSMVSWSRRAFLLLVEFNDSKVASNRNCILRTKVATATSSFTFSGCSTCLVRNRPTKWNRMQMLEVENLHRKLSKPALHSPLNCHLASRISFMHLPSNHPKCLGPTSCGHCSLGINLPYRSKNSAWTVKRGKKSTRSTVVWHQSEFPTWSKRIGNPDCLIRTASKIPLYSICSYVYLTCQKLLHSWKVKHRMESTKKRTLPRYLESKLSGA